MRIEGISPERLTEAHRLGKSVIPDTKAPSFKETFNAFLSDVNSAQKASSDAQKALLSGEINDVHQVMNKSEEAKVAFNMLMEIRNKVLDGYNEVMRIRL